VRWAALADHRRRGRAREGANNPGWHNGVISVAGAAAGGGRRMNERMNGCCLADVMGGLVARLRENRSTRNSNDEKAARKLPLLCALLLLNERNNQALLLLHHATPPQAHLPLVRSFILLACLSQSTRTQTRKAPPSSLFGVAALLSSLSLTSPATTARALCCLSLVSLLSLSPLPRKHHLRSVSALLPALQSRALSLASRSRAALLVLGAC